MISNDFNSTIVSAGIETYKLFWSNRLQEWTQQKIHWLGDKIIASIESGNKDFMFICHKKYDKTIDVESSNR